MVLRRLTSELQKKTEDELNEVPNQTQEDLEHLREWLNKQQHLNVRLEEQWLIGFLRGCKFSLQRTKEKLDYFYTMRTLVPEFFADRDPLLPKIQDVLKVGAILPLSMTDGPAGPRIILCRYSNCNSEKISLVNIIKVFFMLIDILINEDDNFIIAGMCLWIDYKEISFNYILQYTPSFIKKMVTLQEKAYPIRVKNLCFSNAPSTFETIYKVLKSMLPNKLKNRINLSGENNFEKVFDDIPQSLMPQEYGGKGGTTKDRTAYWKNKVESYREWFIEDAKYCSNEQLRLGKPRTSAEVFGVEGSFRKLTVD